MRSLFASLNGQNVNIEFPTSDREPLAGQALVYAPDLFILITIAIAGIEGVLIATICVDVFLSHEMDFGDIPARLLAMESAIEFVHRLPAVQVKRLRHRADLILAFPNAFIGRNTSVGGGDQVRLAVRRHPVGAQSRHREVEDRKST